MDFCKLLLFAILFLSLEIYGHRFERHSTKNITHDGSIIRISEINDIDNNHQIDKHMSFDEKTFVKQDGPYLILIGNGVAKIEVDKNNPELQFELCSNFYTDNCANKNFTLCYDAAKTAKYAREGCGFGQCRFNGGVIFVC